MTILWSPEFLAPSSYGWEASGGDTIGWDPNQGCSLPRLINRLARVLINEVSSKKATITDSEWRARSVYSCLFPWRMILPQPHSTVVGRGNQSGLSVHVIFKSSSLCHCSSYGNRTAGKDLPSQGLLRAGDRSWVARNGWRLLATNKTNCIQWWATGAMLESTLYP